MRFRIFVFAFGFFSLISCQTGTTDDGGTQKEFITDAPPEVIDSTLAPAPMLLLVDSTKTELQKYFNADLIQRIENYFTEYNAVNSDTAFQKNYDTGVDLCKAMTLYFQDPQTNYVKDLMSEDEYELYYLHSEMKELNGQLGPIYVTCVAECSEMDFCFDLNFLNKKAKLTNGNADDDFMDILLYVEGDFGYAGYFDFKVWTKQYWDYGGSNLLGRGVMFDAVRRTKTFKNTHSLFSEQIQIVHQDFLEELTTAHSFEYTKEEVLAEIDKIINLKYFDSDALKVILKHYELIDAGGEYFQFNCSSGECSFG